MFYFCLNCSLVYLLICYLVKLDEGDAASTTQMNALVMLGTFLCEHDQCRQIHLVYLDLHL